METEPMQCNENHSRSLAKAVSYRITNIIADLCVVYLVTQKVSTTIGVVTATNVTSTIIYYLHERGWNHLSWGKIHPTKK